MSVKSLWKAVAGAPRRHAARHRPTGLGFALADSIAYVDPARWDLLASGASIFLSREYLGALEAGGPEGLEGRYAMAFRGRKPVFALAAQSFELSASRLARTRAAPSADPDPSRRAVLKAAAKVRSRALETLTARVLACGNLFSWGPHGVAFAPDEDPAALWPAVAEALHRIRRADSIEGEADLILIKDLPAAAMPPAQALRTYSFRPLETEPDMVIDISAKWRGYDDYLAALSTKYRKSSAGIARDFEAAGLRLEPLAGLERHASTLHGLYLQVHGAAKLRLATLSPAWWPALEEALGPRFRCVAARRGSEILGFVTLLKDGETAVGYQVGFDRRANAEAPIYFRLLQSIVAESIAFGCRRISLGRTALEPKARLGARPEPLHVWARHRVSAVNWVLRKLLGLVHHEEAPERSTFR